MDARLKSDYSHRPGHMMRLAQMARVNGFFEECKCLPDLNSFRRF